MKLTPAAGSAARNQYGTFQVHYASPAQLKYIRGLAAGRVVPNPVPDSYAAEMQALEKGEINKKAASRLIDWLLTLPHAAKSDGTARVTGNAGETYLATEKQVGFLISLVNERPGAKVYVDTQLAANKVEHPSQLSRSEISNVIGVVRDMPKAQRSAAVDVELEAGMYLVGETIYKVYKAVHGSGKMCAKELVIDGEGSAHFEYRGLASRFVQSAAQRMTLEQAKEFGAIYGVCCQCGATLTDEKSIEAGIGPVCASKF